MGQDVTVDNPVFSLVSQPLHGVNGPPHRSISGYRKRPASQSPTTAQDVDKQNNAIRLSERPSPNQVFRPSNTQYKWNCRMITIANTNKMTAIIPVINR